MGICKTLIRAREEAQANANYFKTRYMVFFDMSGNARCERDNPSATHPKEVYVPQFFKERK